MNDESEPPEVVRMITVKDMRLDYRKFRAHLARTTKINEKVFAAWCDVHHQEIVNGYITALGEFKYFDYDEMIAFAREMYARVIGKIKD